jgi:hypothetical protein
LNIISHPAKSSGSKVGALRQETFLEEKLESDDRVEAEELVEPEEETEDEVDILRQRS